MNVATMFTFLPRPFFFLVMSSISSNKMTCMSHGLPLSRRLSGPSMTICLRGETMRRSHGCLASGVLRNSGTTILGSKSRTEGHTKLRWISSKRSKFFSHFILSSNSPANKVASEKPTSKPRVLWFVWWFYLCWLPPCRGSWGQFPCQQHPQSELRSLWAAGESSWYVGPEPPADQLAAASYNEGPDYTTVTRERQLKWGADRSLQLLFTFSNSQNSMCLLSVSR